MHNTIVYFSSFKNQSQLVNICYIDNTCNTAALPCRFGSLLSFQSVLRFLCFIQFLVYNSRFQFLDNILKFSFQLKFSFSFLIFDNIFQLRYFMSFFCF